MMDKKELRDIYLYIKDKNIHLVEKFLNEDQGMGNWRRWTKKE